MAGLIDPRLPILRTPGVRFISLQYTKDAAAELSVLREARGVEMTRWPDAIDDYDETAALVSAIDLVISVCTTVIHLGGALGRPVWVMTPWARSGATALRGRARLGIFRSALSVNAKSGIGSMSSRRWQSD